MCKFSNISMSTIWKEVDGDPLPKDFRNKFGRRIYKLIGRG